MSNALAQLQAALADQWRLFEARLEEEGGSSAQYQSQLAALIQDHNRRMATLEQDQVR